MRDRWQAPRRTTRPRDWQGFKEGENPFFIRLPVFMSFLGLGKPHGGVGRGEVDPGRVPHVDEPAVYAVLDGFIHRRVLVRDDDLSGRERFEEGHSDSFGEARGDVDAGFGEQGAVFLVGEIVAFVQFDVIGLADLARNRLRRLPAARTTHDDQLVQIARREQPADLVDANLAAVPQHGDTRIARRGRRRKREADVKKVLDAAFPRVFRDAAAERNHCHSRIRDALPLPAGAPFVVVHRYEHAMLAGLRDAEPGREKLQIDDHVRPRDPVGGNADAVGLVVVEGFDLEGAL